MDLWQVELKLGVTNSRLMELLERQRETNNLLALIAERLEPRQSWLSRLMASKKKST